MQFISILLALLGDYTRNGLIVCNLISIIPGILECETNKKISFVQLSSYIKTFHMIKICIKIYAKLHFQRPVSVRK